MDRRERKKAALLNHWLAKGSLWPESSLNRIEQKIREEVGEELGGWREVASLPVEVMPAEEVVAKDRRNGEENGYYAMTLREVSQHVEKFCPIRDGESDKPCREAVRVVQEQALKKLRQVPWIRELMDEPPSSCSKAQRVVRQVAVDAALTKAKAEERARRRPLTAKELKRLDEAIERAYAMEVSKKRAARICECGHRSDEHFMHEDACLHRDPPAVPGARSVRCMCTAFRQQSSRGTDA